MRYRHAVAVAIDRRFFRKSYNAGKILERYGAAAAYEVEVERLAEHLASVVEEALQPETVSLWLINGKG